MRTPPSLRPAALLLVALALVVGCGAEADGVDADRPLSSATLDDGDDGDDGDEAGDVGDDDMLGGAGDGALVAADDSIPAPSEPFAGMTSARTTANLNLRKGAGTSYAVLAVIPSGTVVTVLDPTPKNGFLNVKFNGTSGWSHSGYLKAVTSTPEPGGGTTDVNGPPSPDNAIARARAAKGFSYWWGGGAWLASGATSSNRGSCSGSCPSCSHSGKYGADCSGLVAKAWQFGTKALEVNSHPYSTVSFNKDASGKWYTVSRGSMKRGDALVYNKNGAGHIVIYEKGDGWGSPTVYECRGCSYGCVYNTRSFGSSYHGIRRSGF